MNEHLSQHLIHDVVGVGLVVVIGSIPIGAGTMVLRCFPFSARLKIDIVKGGVHLSGPLLRRMKAPILYC